MELKFRYIVETEFRPGEITVVRKTNDKDLAEGVTNFWDERQTTRLRDLLEEEARKTSLERALEQFDQKIASLTPVG